jgi:hypothetical protein
LYLEISIVIKQNKEDRYPPYSETIKTNTNDVLTFVPTIKASGKIKIETVGGNIESTVDFKFIQNTSPTTNSK